VSTDDLEIAEFARHRGALVPWLRPPELASDTASSVDVALHALEWFKSEHGLPDAVLLLQPTSPFRNDASVVRAIDMLATDKANAVVAVGPMRGHPEWALVERHGLLYPFELSPPGELGSLGHRPLWEPCGSFYLLKSHLLAQRRAFIGPGDTPIVLESEVERIDIDTPWDWFVAESVVRANLVPLPGRTFGP
jgi:N-acylneuraminate cytidylyltransferase